MKTKEEIQKKKTELQELYTEQFFEDPTSIDISRTVAQIKILEWVLEYKYITIQEDKDGNSI